MIAITTPSISNTSLGYDFVPTTRLHSGFRIKGSNRPISDSSTGFYTLWDPVTNRWYTYRTAPDYLGQLAWSSAIGSPENYEIIKGKAKLYVAMSDGADGLTWVPCLFTGAAFFRDPSTGDVWDPMGRYTCNPPYLCAG